MPEPTEIMPISNSEATPALKVVAIVYDELCTFEFGIAAEVFGLERPELGASLYDFKSESIDQKTVAAHGCLSFTANGTLTDLEDADTIVIPGWRGKDEHVPELLINKLCRARERGASILAICSGGYVLAATGMLANKRATTHWQYLDHFQNSFPDIDVQENQLYVDEDGIITSAGSSAGIDACLHMVRRDYGQSVAASVARRLVVQSHRHAGHAQLIQKPVTDLDENRINDLISDIRSKVYARYTIASLSKQAGMSSRTFQRRFISVTGLPVMQWLVQERLSMACELLESTDLSVESISEQVGFGSAETLRYHFKHVLQSNPTQYRRNLSYIVK